MTVTPPPPARYTYPGVDAARAQSANGGWPFDRSAGNPGAGWCLKMVRLCYGIPALAADATGAWAAAKVRHRETDPAKFPKGYPLFWIGGSSGHGHIAISAGDGMCWSTDLKRVGFFDKVPIADIHRKWGLTLVGWTEDVNGFPVPAKAAAPPPPIPHRRFFHVPHGQPYHLENSLRGIKGAILKAFRWIDLDCHPTLDRGLVITHWKRPIARDGFFDPTGELKRLADVETMTLEQVKRLRTHDTPPYRISEAARLVEYATTHGLSVELELKSTAITKAELLALRAALSHPERVQVKALPPFYTALKAAHAAGFQTIVLGRNARIPKDAQAFITYRRGKVRWA